MLKTYIEEGASRAESRMIFRQSPHADPHNFTSIGSYKIDEPDQFKSLALEEAIKIYGRIAEKFPEQSAEAKTHIAECLIMQGKSSEAIEVYESFARSNDEQATYRYYDAGETLMKYGHLKEAKSFFAKFLKIHPDAGRAPNAREKLETIIIGLHDGE